MKVRVYKDSVRHVQAIGLARRIISAESRIPVAARTTRGKATEKEERGQERGVRSRARTVGAQFATPPTTGKTSARRTRRMQHLQVEEPTAFVP